MSSGTSPSSSDSGVPVDAGVGDRNYYETWYTSRDWRFYAWLLAQMVEHSAPGPILDMGAGVGYVVEGAQRWGLDCCGIEGSRDAVEMGLRRWPPLRLRQHFLSEPLPFPNGSFQTVVMNQVIEHLEPEVAQRAVAEIFRVLRPGGVAMIYSPSRFNEYERRVDPTHINLYSPTELRKLLLSGGFRRVVSLDDPLPIFGQNRVGRRLATTVFRVTRWDRLSASANARAYKDG